jgi:hypothetical protein
MAAPRPLKGDRFLRAFAFIIHARPKNGPVVWGRNGKLYTESEAHAQVGKDLKAVEKRK